MLINLFILTPSYWAPIWRWALFSASRQTHCVPVACDSKGTTLALYSMWLQRNDSCFTQHVLYIHQSGCSTVLIVTRHMLSQHRKLTLVKNILPLLLLRLKPETFWSCVGCSNHWGTLAPQLLCQTRMWLWNKAYKVAWMVDFNTWQTMHYLKDLPFKTNMKVSVSSRKTSGIYLQYQPKVQNIIKWMLCSKV